jgi:hypothetical protein
LPQGRLPGNILAARCPCRHARSFFDRICEEPFQQDFSGTICEALIGFLKEYADHFVQYSDMAVTIEMQNTGDPRARGEILASVEHVLSDAEGEWRVSIVGSRADDKWEMKVEGPRGFERSYTLVGAAGEHHPEAVRNLLIKLLPPSTR